jgi:hypothetical protein
MKYRIFPKTGDPISLLGLGTMRMPSHGDGKLDHQESVRLIQRAIDLGVNYVDTAYMYHDGESEIVVGKALKEGYREKVFLADKMPVWLAKDEKEMKELFEEQFRRLNVEGIDFYLVHNITVPIWKRAKKYGLMNFLEEQQKKGRIRHVGFSFHDDVGFFEEVLKEYPWDFCQIQLNYMDRDFQAGVKGLKMAKEMGIPTMVMEPLKGGKLTDRVPDSVKRLWEGAQVKRTPAEWALRWVADFPEVVTILSGVHTMEQLEENIKILSEAEPNTLTEKEKRVIERVAAEYNQLIEYACTGCKYCLPCPVKLDIPTVIDLLNQHRLYEGNEKVQQDYDLWFGQERRASACVSCGQCEEKCPQSLPIIEIMKKASAIFD